MRSSGYLEVRKSNWSAFTDVITMSLSTQTSTVATFNIGQGRINLSPILQHQHDFHVLNHPRDARRQLHGPARE